MDPEQKRLIPLSSLLLYNPSQIPRSDLKRLFVVREPEFKELFSRVRAIGDTPQHHLLIAGRGMGKTTILLRLAYAIEDDQELSREWFPICFDEEQYNVGALADLWLNGLAVAADKLGDASLLHKISELGKKYQDQGDKLNEEAFRLFKGLTAQTRRKLALFVDNIDIVLDRIDSKIETRRLREVLTDQEEPWMIMIAASSRPIPATYEYDSPLYELFSVTELEPLDQVHTEKLLMSLAGNYGLLEEIDKFLKRGDGTFETLSTLMGGNPRTVTVLFSVLQAQSGADLSKMLTQLLDLHTSNYKDRIEALPTQGQRVFDALAQNWNPATAEQIANALRIDRGAASAQLHRLVDRGLVRKVKIPERPMGFLIKERFFNIWCLMRGEHRNEKKLQALLEFLRIFNTRRDDRLKGFRRFIEILKYIGLLNEVSNAKFVDKIGELEGDSRPLLPGIQPHEENLHAEVLALCSLGRLGVAESIVDNLLKLHPDSLFAKLAKIHILEGLGRQEESLAILEDCVNRETSSDWLRIEYSRILLALDKLNEASLVLMPLMNHSELPPEQLTRAALDLVEVGGDSVAWLAQALVKKAKEANADDIEVALASCRLELLLERVDRALEVLDILLNRYDSIASDRARFEILDLVIEVARVDRARDVLELLRASRLAERWLPLAYALESLDQPDTGVLERLAPELQEFTLKVTARITLG